MAAIIINDIRRMTRQAVEQPDSTGQLQPMIPPMIANLATTYRYPQEFKQWVHVQNSDGICGTSTGQGYGHPSFALPVYHILDKTEHGGTENHAGQQ